MTGGEKIKQDSDFPGSLWEDKEGASSLVQWGSENAKKKRKKSKSPRKPSISDRCMQLLVAELEQMQLSQDWSKATHNHFVAWYVVTHEQVYNVVPIEVTPQVRFKMSMQAKRVLEKEFLGDAKIMADFMGWTWQKEAAMFQRNAATRRFNCWFQFSPTTVSDYRHAKQMEIRKR